jgi:hypothetical protein
MVASPAELEQLIKKQQKQINALQDKIDGAYTNPSLLFNERYLRMVAPNFQPDSVTAPAIADGAVTLPAIGDNSILGWQFDATFSATNYRVVAWTSGTITLSDGTTYAIDAGNTGNLAALNYIYFDSAVSTTVLQKTTTAATAIGANKILIGVAQNVAETAKSAIYQVFGGAGGVGQLITTERIATDAITANEIAANTITAAEITADGIIGRKIATAASGARTEMKGADATTGVAIYDANGIRISLNGSELTLFAASDLIAGSVSGAASGDVVIKSGIGVGVNVHITEDGIFRITRNEFGVETGSLVPYLLTQTSGQKIGYYAGSTNGSGDAVLAPEDVGLTTVVRAVVSSQALDTNHNVNCSVVDGNISVKSWNNSNTHTGPISFAVIALGT